MGIKDYIKNKRLVKSFGKLALGLLLALSVVSILDLHPAVEIPLIFLLCLIFLGAVSFKIEKLFQKDSKRQLYHLLIELDIGVINFSKLTVFQAINQIVEKLRDRNLKETRYRENLFKQMDLGIITFDEKLQIKRSSLTSLRSIFPKGSNPHNKNVAEYLFTKSELGEDELNGIEFHFTSVLGMTDIQWKLSSSSFPEEVIFRVAGRKHYIKMRYIPIFQGEIIKEISIILQDVTEHKKFESEAVRREQEIEKIFALLQVSDSLFELFMDETRSLFDGIKADLKAIRTASDEKVNEIANRMFRSVHTIKANSKLFKLNSIQDVAHEVESYLSDLRSGKIQYDAKSFMELTQKVMAISEEIYSYASLRKEILSSIDRKRDQNLKYRVQWIRSLLNQFAYIIRDPQFEPRHLRNIQKEFGRVRTHR